MVVHFLSSYLDCVRSSNSHLLQFLPTFYSILDLLVVGISFRYVSPNSYTCFHIHINSAFNIVSCLNLIVPPLYMSYLINFLNTNFSCYLIFYTVLLYYFMPICYLLFTVPHTLPNIDAFSQIAMFSTKLKMNF